MRILTAGLCAVLVGAGCAAPKSSAPAARNSSSAVVTPDFRPVGRVEMVNTEARFVVLSFPGASVPPAGRRLSINHNGLKIGTVKITGPQRDYDTVADLVEGEANVGDEVKGD